MPDIAPITNITVRAVGTGRTFSNVLGFILKRWRISITLLFVAIISIHAAIDSIEQNSLYPLAFELGGRIFGADANLYKISKEDIKFPEYSPPNDQIRINNWIYEVEYYISIFYFFFSIFFSFWILYFFFHFFESVWSKILIDSVIIQWGIALVTLIIFQIAFALILLVAENSVLNKPVAVSDIFSAFIPLRGVASFFVAYVPQIIDKLNGIASEELKSPHL